MYGFRMNYWFMSWKSDTLIYIEEIYYANSLVVGKLYYGFLKKGLTTAFETLTGERIDIQM